MPFGFACTMAVLLGVLVRARPVLLADFPLNDGGLFYLMAEELQHARFRLPAFTAYNTAGIPFAYPPFGLYAAAALADATPWTLMQIVRVLPLAITCATLVAFLLLAREMLRERIAVVAALTAFALVPRSFMWLVMGGGLTRSFGFLFSIVALHQAYLAFTRRQTRYAVTAGLFTGLTPLSHLGTAPFLAMSLCLFALAYGRHRRGLTGMAIIGAVAVAVSAPWWLTVVQLHGFGPFSAARATGGSILTPELGRAAAGRLARLGALATGEPLFPIIGVVALLGGLVSLTRLSLTLPVWWVATLALDARAGATYATLPLSLLAGVGVAEVLRPLLMSRATTAPDFRPTPTSRVLTVAVTTFAIAYCTVAAMIRNADMGAEAATLSSLSRDEREAMQWVDANTPPQSRFFVAPEAGWPYDKVAEWFPVLSRRQSVATVQGREWLPNAEFSRYADLYRQALQCSARDTRCLDEWTSTSGEPFSYVFIPRAPAGACCRSLSTSLRGDPRYSIVFDGRGGEVFLRRTVNGLD